MVPQLNSNSLMLVVDSLQFNQQTSIMDYGVGRSSNGSVVFGSQLIDQNSSTPYSDATQVRSNLFFHINYSNQITITGT